MKIAVITGGDGFIGRHLIQYLLGKGYQVYAFVFKSDESINGMYADECVQYLPCDLCDVFDYEDTVPDNADIMFHFAWTGVKPELRSDLDVQMANIAITMKCLEFAEKKGIKKFLYPGSTNEYLYYGKPLNDDAVPSPMDAYGSIKVALRYICAQYAKQHNISFLYVIITGIYAPDRRDNNVIFYTIESLLRGEKPMLTKLEQQWDYVYIDDVIEALYLVGEKGINNTVYAIGHGDNWRLSKYIEIIRNKIDRSLPLGIGEKPYDGDRLPSSCIDLFNITRDTGFKPRVDFEQGIDNVIKIIRKDFID